MPLTGKNKVTRSLSPNVTSVKSAKKSQDREQILHLEHLRDSQIRKRSIKSAIYRERETQGRRKRTAIKNPDDSLTLSCLSFNNHTTRPIMIPPRSWITYYCPRVMRAAAFPPPFARARIRAQISGSFAAGTVIAACNR